MPAYFAAFAAPRAPEREFFLSGGAFCKRGQPRTPPHFAKCIFFNELRTWHVICWNKPIYNQEESPVELDEDLPSEDVLALRQRIIGASLRQSRRDLDISQRKLAEMVGIPKGRMSQYEKGERVKKRHGVSVLFYIQDIVCQEKKIATYKSSHQRD